MMKVLSLLLLIFNLNTNAAVGDKAPDFDVSEWINGDAVSIEDLRGQVVVIDFFQLWCPSCNTFSIPLMHQWEEKYAQAIQDKKLKILSIHTVFEGHALQTPMVLKGFLKLRGIEHLVGNDRLAPGQTTPETMKRYQTLGTPEVAIIDQHGVIRFQRAGFFDVPSAERLIEGLLQSS